MKKVAYQTSRVHWHMGQALLPEHFIAQEQSLREEVNLRLRMSPAPSWGLGTLQWDGFQLLKGIIHIQEMTLVMPSGMMVDIPGNTSPAILNLKTVGATKASVYVHLQSASEIVHVEADEIAEEGIERLVQKVEISSNPSSATSMQSFKLAEFQCGADGVWSLDPDYLPPSLQVGPSPFFDRYIERMNAVQRTFQQQLMSEIQENHLSGESQATAKQCLHGVYAFQAMLVDLKNEVHHHPYDVFRAVRALYIDACIWSGTNPAELGRPYTHEDLATCFKALLDEVERLLRVGRQEIPYVEFTRKEGLYVCELEKNIKRARDVYFLIQKPQVSSRIDVSRVKLAGPSRIHVVHEHALRGIPFTPLEKPPFHHGLSSSVEFYTITPGQEWDYAIRDGKVVLFTAPQLEGTRLYLYWRLD
ncbi:MAG: type VI secretion system baseplate subunit TssK [Minicystis sp.]